jgi:hypothetical protein
MSSSGAIEPNSLPFNMPKSSRPVCKMRTKLHDLVRARFPLTLKREPAKLFRDYVNLVAWTRSGALWFAVTLCPKLVKTNY